MCVCIYLYIYENVSCSVMSNFWWQGSYPPVKNIEINKNQKRKKTQISGFQNEAGI